MSNTFGQLFRFTTWGESHGQAIGCVVDGCPALLPLTEEDFTLDMNRRRPGQSSVTTARKEDDKVSILSGTFEGKTTGTPISLIVWNQDQKSRDYDDIKDKFRPNHADYTYYQKYGIRDYRGGGRSSARETAMRVAAGTIAKKILKLKGISCQAYMHSLGESSIHQDRVDLEFVNKNPFFCPDKTMLPVWEELLAETRKKGDSLPARIVVTATSVPVGLGEPIYGKCDARIAEALMSINAVKSVSIGAGEEFLKQTGSLCADEMSIDDHKNIQFSNNFSGGLLGGITSSQDIVASFVVKPTSSITIPRKTVTVQGENTTLITKGRHDPCVGIRAVPVAEAMMACVLADLLLLSLGRRSDTL